MERFKRYEESFMNSCRIVARNSKNLSSTGKDWSKYDALLSLTVSTEDEVSEAEAFLAALESETASLPMHEQQLMELRVEECREDFRKTCAQFRQAVAAAEKSFMDRAPPSRTDTSANGGRVPPKTSFEVSSGSLSSLQDSRKIIAQTDDIGSGTISSLENQRYQLLDAQDKVSATNSVTEMAGKVLTMMANRAFRWKAFLVFMILLQFALIVIVIYYGFAKE